MSFKLIVIDVIIALRCLLTRHPAPRLEDDGELISRSTHLITNRNRSLIRAFSLLVNDPEEKEEIRREFIEVIREEEGSLEMSWIFLDQPDDEPVLSVIDR